MIFRGLTEYGRTLQLRTGYIIIGSRAVRRDNGRNGVESMEIAAVFIGARQSLEAVAAMGSKSQSSGSIPDWPFCVLLLVPLLLILVVLERKKKDVKGAYYASLQRLRQDPGNRRLQARTVKLARKYIRGARGRRGYSDVDEPAIIDELFTALHKATPSETPRNKR
jgi:hypothetical protein